MNNGKIAITMESVLDGESGLVCEAIASGNDCFVKYYLRRNH
jgi:hypothetical protein